MRKKIITIIVSLIFVLAAVFGAMSISAASSDGYGSVPSEYSSVTEYPFAVFKRGSSDTSYTFVAACNNLYSSSADTQKNLTMGAFQTAKNAVTGGTDTDDVAVILMRCDFTNISQYENTTQLYDGKIILDLNSHTLTTSYTILNAISKGSVGEASSYEIKNGSIVSTKGALILLNSSSNYTPTTQKTFNFKFTNVRFSMGTGFADSNILTTVGSFNSTVGVNYNISLDSCYFDLKTNLPSGVAAPNIVSFAETAGRLRGTLDISGCKITAASAGGYTFNTDTNDAVTYTKHESGVYLDLAIPYVDKSTYPYDGVTISSTEGKTLSFGLKYYRSESDNIIYSLGEPLSTAYGDIPYRYSNTTLYPIAVFKDGAFVSATDVFSSASGGALETARTILTEHSRKVATVLLRKNIDVSGVANNTGLLGAVIDIDLGGFTLNVTAGSAVGLFNAQAKNLGHPATFIIRDGRIILKSCPLLKTSAYSTATGGYRDATDEKYKEFLFTFSNVSFSFAKGATVTNLVMNYKDELYAGTGDKAVLNTVSFNACTFDLSKAPSGFTLFNANDPTTSSTNGSAVNSITKIYVNGCEFTTDKSITNYIFYDINVNNGSEVLFDSEESRSTLRTPIGSPAPAFSVHLGTGDMGVFAKASGDAHYTLTSSKHAHSSFTPLASLTLGSELVFNVYLPKISSLTKVSFNSASTSDFSRFETETVNGVTYYKVETPLGASVGAGSIVVKVYLNEGGSEREVTYTFGLLPYLEKLLLSGTDEEKQLAKDIVSYVRAAYAYFGTKDASAVSKMNALIGNSYDAANPPAAEGSKTAPNTSHISAVGFSLNSMPVMRFYIPKNSDVSKYSFYIGSIKLTAKSGSDSEGDFISLAIPARLMTEAVDCRYGGNTVAKYHIASYLEFAKTTGDAKLVSLVERFIKYCQSAGEYVKAETSALSHTHSFSSTTYEPTAYSRGYVERVCSCGYTTVSYTTGLTDKTSFSVQLVGNSYTHFNSLYLVLRDVCASGGYVVSTGMSQDGGHKLISCLNDGDSVGDSLKSALAGGDIDFVFLQEQSVLPVTEPGKFYDGVRGVGKLATDAGARVVLYQTWGRKAPEATLTSNGLTPKTMAWKLAAAYEAIADECGYSLSPAGSAMLDVYMNYPSIDLYTKDHSHPSDVGTYLVALCHYATLTGKSPIGLAYQFGLDPETALILQTAAHNAVFGKSIVPDSYKVSSVGISASGNQNNLTAIPAGSTLISAGITGTKGAVSSTATCTAASGGELTAQQKADLADIGYGVSVLGVKTTDRELSKLVDGVWSSSTNNRTSLTLTGEHFYIDGTVDMNEAYVALVTLNFGKQVNMTAIGYMSGNMKGFAQEQDVWISNDGVSWSQIFSASYNATGGTALKSLTTLPTDKNSNTPGVAALFDMNSATGGVTAQYVRVAIRQGAAEGDFAGGLNTLELAVYGKAD